MPTLPEREKKKCNFLKFNLMAGKFWKYMYSVRQDLRWVVNVGAELEVHRMMVGI